jgi:hypothetical protein
MALSSLIINAYYCMGHGAKILSSYTSRLFHLSAVMYVDDTNLLHWPPSLGAEPDNLIKHVQRATMDYSRLAQASGGILKENKCSVNFLDYKVVCSRFQMKSPWDLPQPRLYIMEVGRAYPAHIHIPQPNGPDAYIEMHNINTVSKMLGVYFSLAGNSNTHINHTVKKGLDWVDSLQAKLVSCSDKWLSMYLQLLPAISWGLVTVCMQPSKLDKKIHKVYE